MSKKTLTTPKKMNRSPRVVQTGPTARTVEVDLHVRNRRAKLIASKRAAGLSPDLAESTADRQLDMERGIVRSAFADPALDREEAIATAGVNTNAAQLPTDPNSDEVPQAEVHIETDATE